MNIYQLGCEAYFGGEWTFYVKATNKADALNKGKSEMSIKGNMKIDTLRVIKKMKLKGCQGIH